VRHPEQGMRTAADARILSPPAFVRVLPRAAIPTQQPRRDRARAAAIRCPDRTPGPASRAGVAMKERHPRKFGGRPSKPRNRNVVRPARFRDGVALPFSAPSVADVLATCPFRMILSLQSLAAISAFWMMPDDPPPTWPTVPDFVIDAAAKAVLAGHAFLLFGRDEAAVERAAFRISAALAPPVVT
jgi:hypothetical protein